MEKGRRPRANVLSLSGDAGSVMRIRIAQRRRRIPVAGKTLKMLLVVLLSVFTLGSLAEAAPKKVVRHRVKPSARVATANTVAKKHTVVKKKTAANARARIAKTGAKSAAKARAKAAAAKSKTTAKRPATTKPS